MIDVKAATISVYNLPPATEPQVVHDFYEKLCTAYDILVNTMHPTYVPAIQNIIHLNEILKYMTSTYEKVTIMSQVYLFQTFCEVKMKEGTTLKVHLAWFDQFRHLQTRDGAGQAQIG